MALLEVQDAYYQARIRVAEIELDTYLRKHRWVAGMLVAERFEAMISAQVLARLDREAGGGMSEAQIIEDMRQDRLDRAYAIRARTAAAMVPLTVVASFFAIEGASDLFLAAFPGRMATDLVEELARLRRAGKAARALEESPQLRHLHDLLDDQQARFLRGVRKLDPRQRGALLEIGNKVAENTRPAVIIALMEGATKGHADLAWIAAKLRKGHFDGAFVTNFTRYDARPTWRQLQMLLDNSIAPATRASLVSKLAGFRGEEAAAKLVEKQWFREKYLMKAKGKARTKAKAEPKDLRVLRGDGSLDLVVWAEDESAAVFAEVKNWSGPSWLTGREKVKEQLRLHNQRIELLLEQRSRAAQPEKINKLLMVEENGWMLLDPRVRGTFEREIAALGRWKLQVMPGRVSEDTGQFIDRLRK